MTHMLPEFLPVIGGVRCDEWQSGRNVELLGFIQYRTSESVIVSHAMVTMFRTYRGFQATFGAAKRVR
jgi:hypothetical protein